MCQLRYKSKWLSYLILILMLCLTSCVPYYSQPAEPSSPEQPQSPPVEDAVPDQPENRPPIIHSIQAQEEIAPSGSVQISCIATDSDDDELFYSWSAEYGSFTGKGDTITWTAPNKPGEYTISATVNDGSGSEAWDSITITVAPIINRYPIVSLVMTPRGESPINIVSASDPITVREWTVIEIECIASDPDGDKLDYKWYVTEGKIDGEGAKVSYIAKGRGEQIITVAVTDSTGRKSVANIRLRVRCCGG